MTTANYFEGWACEVDCDGPCLRTTELPEKRHSVLRKLWIACYDNKVFYECLRDKKPVKRVFVVSGKILHLKRMVVRDH